MKPALLPERKVLGSISDMSGFLPRKYPRPTRRPNTPKNGGESLQNHIQDGMAGAIPGHDRSPEPNSSKALLGGEPCTPRKCLILGPFRQELAGNVDQAPDGCHRLVEGRLLLRIEGDLDDALDALGADPGR